MGAALSSAYSSLVSVVESFCRESYSWISSLFGGGGGSSGMSNKGDDNNNGVVIRSRGLNFNDADEEAGVVIKSRGLDLSVTEEVKQTESSSASASASAATQLGDIWKEVNVKEAYGNGKIRSIVPTEESPAQPLKVTFTNDSTSQEIILCWISPNGDLHHYYRLPPQGGSHLENTKTGDAFVVFEAQQESVSHPEDPSSNSHGDEEEAWEPVCNHNNVVAAYRPQSCGKSNHHVVTLGQIETIVTSAGGFLRGSVKKQKTLQWTISVAPKEPKPELEIIDTSNKHYEKTKYGEWTVYYEPGCWDATENGETKEPDEEEKKEGPLGNTTGSVHEVFQADLKALSQRLPEHVREVLCESTVLYINTTHSVAQKVDNAVGCFHPGRDWLVEHKMNPAKCGQVEFYNVTNYANHRKLWGTGGIILHEFCHAYHNKHLPDGYDNQDIIDCYQAAMDEGLYDHCNYHACYVGDGSSNDAMSPFGEQQSSASQQPEYEIGTMKHYACTSPMEYFAELSVAFLASPQDDSLPQQEYNKWYPHNAQQLKEHDPRAFALLQKLWGVEEEEMQ